MMNTGYVGGSVKEVQAGVAHKVKIRHSSAMLEALITESIQWTEDPDFGYLVVDLDAPENAALIEKVPAAILRPATLFEANGRMDEYRAWVGTMKSERRTFLENYGVDADIIDATANDK